MLSETTVLVKGLAPAADRFNTNPATDVVNLGLADSATFLIHYSGGTTGKATVTVEACTAADGTGATAVPFRYRSDTNGASDVRGAVTNATAAGVDTVPAEEHILEVEIKASELPAGSKFVRAKLTESVNDPVNGSVMILLRNPRFQGKDMPTVLA